MNGRTNKGIKMTVGAVIIIALLILVSVVTLASSVNVSDHEANAVQNIAGTRKYVSSAAVGGVTVLSGASNTELSKNDFWLYTDHSGVEDNFFYYDDRDGWGFKDYNPGDDTAFVYYLEYEFTGDMLAAVQQNRVSYAFSCDAYWGQFWFESNDEHAVALQWLNQTAPTETAIGSSRSGSDASWTTAFTNTVFYNSGWSDPDDKHSYSTGDFNGYNSSEYHVSTTATGIRIVFGLINDGNAKGGFGNIKLKFFTNLSATVNAGANGSITSGSSPFTTSSPSATRTFEATPNNGYIFQDWTKTNFLSAPNSTASTPSLGSATITGAQIRPSSVLTANFNAITYNISYDNHGIASATLPSAKSTTGASTFAQLGKAVATGFTFLGWSADITSVSADYTETSQPHGYDIDSSKPSNGVINITLYAIWEAPTYQQDGVTVTGRSPQTYQLYDDVTFTITSTKAGYNLVGVYATYTNGDLYGTDGAKVALAGSGSSWTLFGICGNFRLSGEWASTSVAIKYYVGSSEITPGGSAVGGWTLNSNAPTSAVAGSTINMLTFAPSTSNYYTFLGWATSSSSTSYLAEYVVKGSGNNIYLRYDTSGISASYSTPSKWSTQSGSNQNYAYYSNDGGDSQTGYGYGFSSNSNNNWTSYAYQDISFSSVSSSLGKLLSYSGTKTVRANFQGRMYGRRWGGTSASNSEAVYMGISSVSVGSYSSVPAGQRDSQSQSNSSTTATQNTFNKTVSFSTTDASFRLWLGGHVQKHDGWYNHYCYVFFTSITFTVTTTAGTSYTFTLNRNSPSGAAAATSSVKLIGSTTYTFPTCLWSEKGYEFVGWSSGASSGTIYAPGSTATISSASNYYARWTTKKYPVITYDIFTDGTNYATEIRKEYYAEYNAHNVAFNSGSNTTGYTYSSSTYQLYPKSGGNDYSGFTNSANQSYTKYLYDVTSNSPSKPTNTRTWTYSEGSQANTVSAANVDGPIWAYYIWQMNVPTVSSVGADPNVNYGTSVYLPSLITPNHGDQSATITIDTWLHQNNGTMQPYLEGTTPAPSVFPFFSGNDGEAVTHYSSSSWNHWAGGDATIYSVAESGTYGYTITATTTRGNNVTLSKSRVATDSEYITVTINPIKLAITYDEDNQIIIYDGGNHAFAMIAEVDTSQYNGATLTALQSVFAIEENNASAYHGSSNVNIWKGVDVSILAMGYISFLDSNATEHADLFYGGTNSTTYIRDAGTYYANKVQLSYHDTVAANKNYVFTVNDSQLFRASDISEVGTAYTTILPRTHETVAEFEGNNFYEGIKLYAYYTYKEFGNVYDQTPQAVFSLSDVDTSDLTHWYLIIEGLTPGDKTDAISNALLTGLFRDTSSNTHNKAGRYNVGVAMNNASFPYVLLNNYGCVIADSSFTQLSQNAYYLTEDTSIQGGKTYYTRSPSYNYTAVITPVLAQIATYYELSGGVYTLTSDTAINGSKTYYTRNSGYTYTSVGSPNVANIGTYYERVSAATVKLYFYDEDGTLMSNTPYDYRNSWNAYTQTHNNFEIKPKQISLEDNSPTHTFAYNGTQRGLTQVISSGVLSQAQQSDFQYTVATGLTAGAAIPASTYYEHREEGVYKKTSDGSINAGKEYFTIVATQVVSPNVDNIGYYYERSGSNPNYVYTLTTDTALNGGKTYYTVVATKVNTPVAGNLGTYYERSYFVLTNDSNFNVDKITAGSYYTKNTYYDQYFEIYFYGITAPAGWGNTTYTTPEAQSAYVAAHISEKKIAGSGSRIFVNGTGSNYIQFLEVNAGTYGVIIVGAAYYNGVSYIANDNFSLGGAGFYYFGWEITPLSIEVTATNNTTTFGDIDYGGMSFTFTNLVAGDTISTLVLVEQTPINGSTSTVYNTASSNNTDFLRYADPFTGITSANNVRYIYGLVAGTYETRISSVTTTSSTAAAGSNIANGCSYGASAGNNYTILTHYQPVIRPVNSDISNYYERSGSEGNYTYTLTSDGTVNGEKTYYKSVNYYSAGATISQRQLNVDVSYTTNGGRTYVSSKPNDGWNYDDSYKGVKIEITGFFANNFATQDISADGTAANIKVPVATVLNYLRIHAIEGNTGKSHSDGNSVDNFDDLSEFIAFNTSTGTGLLTYYYLGINARTYTVTLKTTTFKYNYQSTDYQNFILGQDYSPSFTINKKTATVVWKIDGSVVNNVTYDANEHTVTATFTGSTVESADVFNGGASVYNSFFAAVNNPVVGGLGSYYELSYTYASGTVTSGKTYFTISNGSYVPVANLTVGNAIPSNTYYVQTFAKTNDNAINGSKTYYARASYSITPEKYSGDLEQTDAGSYSASISYDNSGSNYNITNTTFAWTISRRTFSITLGEGAGDSYLYDGTQKSISLTLNGNGCTPVIANFLNNVIGSLTGAGQSWTTTASYSGGELIATDVGQYTFGYNAGSGLDVENNWRLTGSLAVTTAFAIVPRVAHVTWQNADYTHTYDNTDYARTVMNALTGRDGLVYTYSITSNISANNGGLIHVKPGGGAYQMVITGVTQYVAVESPVVGGLATYYERDNSNLSVYTLTTDNAVNGSKTYYVQKTTNYVIANASHSSAWYATYSGSERMSYYTTNCDNATFGYNDNDNAISTYTKNITINPITITLTPVSMDPVTYDGNVHGFTLAEVYAEQDKSLMLAADRSDYTFVGSAGKQVNVGDYKINVTGFACTRVGATYSDYVLSASVDIDWAINERTITIKYIPEGLTFSLTSDGTVNNGKDYYIREAVSYYVKVENPVNGDLGTYYEFRDATYSAASLPFNASTNYFTRVAADPYYQPVVHSKSSDFGTYYVYNGSSYVAATGTYDENAHYFYRNTGYVYTLVADPVAENIGSYFVHTRGGYFLTEDGSVIGGKRYYQVVNAYAYTRVSDPTDGELGSYYEVNSSVTYDGNAHGYRFVIDGLLADEYTEISIVNNNILGTGSNTWTIAAYAGGVTDVIAIDANPYSIASVSIDDAVMSSVFFRSSNYALSTTGISRSWQINQLPVTLSWQLDSLNGVYTVTYDGNPHTMTATVTNVVVGDTVTVTSYTNRSATDVNSYTATATALSNANYTLVGGTGVSHAYSITQRAITPSWGSGSYTYDSTYQGKTLTISNLITGDVVTFTVNIYTGSYSGALVGSVDVNKTVAAGSVSITAADLALTKNANTYYAILSSVITGAKGGNYSYTPAANNDRTTYTIAQRALTVTYTDYHSSGSAYVYDNNNHGFTLVVGNIVSGEYLNITFTDVNSNLNVSSPLQVASTNSTNFYGKNAATYSLSGMGISNAVVNTVTYLASNYTLPGSGTNASRTINPKPVTLSWTLSGDENSDFSIVYDGAPHTMTATVTNKATEGDVVTVTAYTGNTQTNVGSYTATATTLSNGNYTVSGGTNVSAGYSITARPLTAGWADTARTYNHASQDVSVLTITNIAANDRGDLAALALTVGVYFRTKDTSINGGKTYYTYSAGTFNAVASPVAGQLANYFEYTTSYARNTNAYALTSDGTIVANKAYFTYSAGVYTRVANPVQGSIGTYYEATAVTYTFSGINAGDYVAWVSAKTGTSSGNYSMFASTSHDYSISQLALSISSWTETASPIYKKANYSVVANVGNGGGDTINLTYETVSTSGTQYSVTGGANTGNVAMDAKSYTTTITAVSNDNYTLTGGTNLSKNWTISPKNLTVFTYQLDGANNFTTTYNGSAHTVTATVTTEAVGQGNTSDGKAYTGDTVTLGYTGVVTTNYGSSAITTNSAIYAGVYKVKITSTGNTNYVVNGEVSYQSFTINRLVAEFTWSTSELEYNGLAQSVSATLSNRQSVGGTPDVYTLTYSGETQTNVSNSYSASVTAIDNGNYTLTGSLTSTHAWAIVPIILNFSWTSTTRTYNHASQVGANLTVGKISAEDANSVAKLALTIGAYVKTRDTSISGGKTYYTYSAGVFSSVASPVAGQLANYYEFLTANASNVSAYELTEDVAINASKTYYTYSAGVYTKVNNPVVGSIGTYYEFITKYTVSGTNADTYYAYVVGKTGTSANNYTLPENVSQSFVINKLPIVLSWSADGGTYKAAAYYATATVDNRNGDSITLTYRTQGDVTGYNSAVNYATNADTYTTSVTAVSNGNYTVDGGTNTSTTWTISPKNLSVFTYQLDGAGSFTTTYNGSAHTLTATVTSAATATNDGKTYTGDSVTLGYTGVVTTDYGDSAISNNSATFAGVYKVKITSTGNPNYTVNGEVSYRSFTISKRVVTVTTADYIASDTYIYSGTAHGKRVTVGNVVSGDNDNTNFNISYSYSNVTVSAHNRTGGTSVYRDFTAINAGTYSGTVSITGARINNYELPGSVASVAVTFTITPKDITTDIVANTTNHTWTYAARAITAADLNVTFSNLVTGESIGTDFTVTYKASGVTIAAPTNVGTYTATITLNNTVSANNYNLVNSVENPTTFEFAIVKYEITPSMLSWRIGLDSVGLESIVYSGTNKTIVADISDAVYNTVSGKAIGYKYFGFCNGAINETYAECLADNDHCGSGEFDHQWLLDNGNFRTTGPVHAGTYWVVLTLSGGDYANFAFTGFDGYADNTHFTTSAGNTYLTYYNDPSNYAISSALPVLGDSIACLTFGINRAQQGADIVTAPSSLPYKGVAYTTGAHTLTSDTSINTLKTYYTGVFSAVASPDVTFISTYYERVYTLTSDDDVVGGKTYYVSDGLGGYEEVLSPLQAEIDTYYERSYVLTSDNAINGSKTYYTGAFTPLASNANVTSYYERSGSNPNYVYTKTNDTSLNGGHTYYSATFTSVSTPLAENLSSYYERSGSAPNYVYTKTNDVAIDNEKTYYIGEFVALAQPSASRLYEYYEYYGLPYISGKATGANIMVQINSNSYTYAEYVATNYVKNAGSYTIRIYDANAGEGLAISGCDYFSNNASFESITYLTITKSKITILDNRSSSNAWKKTYDKTTNFTTYTYATGVTFDEDVVTDGVMTGTTVTISAAYNDANAGARNITFTIGGVDANNYYLAFAYNSGVVADANVTVVGNAYTIAGYINQREIRVVSSSAYKTYDGTNALSPFVITSTDILEDDRGTVDVMGTFEQADVGENLEITITIVNDTNGNYVLTGALPVTMYGTILAKDLELTWTNTTTYTYDKTAHGVSVTVAGMVAGHYETINVTGTNVANSTITANGTTSYTAINANNYAVSLALALGNNSNYTLSGATTYKAWTINQRPVTISWTKDVPAEWTDNEVTFSNSSRYVSAAIASGKIESDTLSLTVTGNTGTYVNEYTATASLSATGDYANYVISGSNTYAWEIVNATITGVTFSNLNVVYNHAAQGPVVSTLLSQHGLALTAVYSGGVNQTAGLVGTGNNARTNVGYSDISVTLSAANYNDLVLNARVTISKASLDNITMSGGTYTFDNTTKTISTNTTTTSYGETATVTYTMSSDGGANYVSGHSASNAGTYYIKASITAGSNYNDKEINVILTINKADITLNVATESGTIIYDTEYHGITVTNTVTQHGYPLTKTYTGGEIVNGVYVGQAKNAGTYSIGVTITAGDNYNTYNTSVELTINQKEIALNYPNPVGGYTYNGNVQDLTVTTTSGATADNDYKVYTGDVVNVALTVAGTSGAANGTSVFRNAGNYTITPSIDNSNYVIKAADVSRSYTIAKADVTGYYFVGNTIPYNGGLNYISVNNTNSVNTNNVTSVTLLAGNVGTVTYKYNTVSAESAYNDTFAGARYAGTYYLQASIDGGGNYNAWSRTATLVINPIDLIGYSMVDASATYDGSAKSLSVTLTPEYAAQLYSGGNYYSLAGDQLTLTYSISANNGSTWTNNSNSATNVNIIDSSVAPYKVKLTITTSVAAASSYNAGSLIMIGDLTIRQATISGIIYDDILNQTYDANPHNVEPTLSDSVSSYYSFNQDKTQLTIKLSASHNGGNGDTFNVTSTLVGGDSAVHVGTYDFNFAINLNGNTNYAPYAGLSATVTIVKATMNNSSGAALVQNTSIFYNGGTFTYDAQTYYPIIATTNGASALSTTVGNVLSTYTVYPHDNLSHSDTADITYTVNSEPSANGGVKNAGSYTIIATLTNSDYNSLSLTANVTINKADIPFYFVGTTLTYDAATHYIGVNSTNAYLNSTVSAISLCSGRDAATIAYTYTSTRNGSGTFNGATNADTYVVTATLTVSNGMGNNYNYWDGTNSDNDLTVNLVINKFDATVTWVNDDAEFTYNGENRTSLVTASFDDVGGNHVAMTVTFLGTSGKATGDTVLRNAGVYTVTASYVTDNYDFTGEKMTFSMEIEQADVVLYFVSATVNYDGNIKYLAVNKTNAYNVVNNANYTSIPMYAGEYVTINYTYDKDSSTPLVLDHDTYYDGSDTVELTNGARNAGTYSVTASLDLGVGASNYKSWANDKTATLTINKISLAQDGGTFTKTYDRTTDIPNIGTISGIVSADESYLTIGGSFSDKNAGNNKTVTFTLTAETNYEYLLDNYILPASVTGIINPKPITLTYTDVDSDSDIDDDDKYLTWTKTYDGTANISVNVNTMISGIIAGDTVTVTARYNSKNVLAANSIVFTKTGADSANYTISNVDFSTYMSTNSVKLITPYSLADNAHIHWSTDVMAYNGTVRSYGAYVTLLGADSTEENGGQFDFVLTLNRTHNGAGVASAANNVDLRDAGTYVATIDLNYNNLPSAIKALYTAEAYADLKANYSVGAYTHTYTITRVSSNVTWSIGSYTYNGTDQSGSVSASITLLGTDVTTYGSTDYLTIAFNRNSVASTFQNAGAYELIASFTVDALANNYILTGYTNNATINKANVVNIAFAGTDGWTYYAGETYYYFVVAAGSNPTYAKTSALDFTPASFVHRDALGNLIDNDPIVITYSAGEYSHANASGNNGVKNAGSYTITATVDTTDNFNQWSGSITVTIAQGWINDYEHNDHGIVNNIVMYGYSTTYDGNQHRVFAFNGTLGNTPRSEFVQVLNPDGSVATVTYNIDINAYENEDYDPLSPLFDPDSNYAVDAGTYAVGAVIAATGNYHQCVIQNVFLIINPLARNITWLYADNYVANFRYNATDQASRVTAQIQRVDGGVTTDFYLSVAFQLDRQSLFDTIDNDTFAALEHVFVIAGDYTVTASIPVGAADYEQIVNNYTLNTPYVDITMNQFVVSINWYYDCDHVVGTPEEYDEPCEYDKTTHGVSAKGYGVGGVEMDIVTSGTFSAVNAGDYVASVSSIVAGTDTIASVLVNGQPCQLPYTFNYTLDNTVLNWAIARREVNIVTGATLISKIYDGSAIFSLGSYSVNELGNNPPTVVSKTWTYTTSNASAYNSQIIYTMTNIISGDFNDMTLLIATVEADKANVNASSATVTFNNAELNSNYVIVGANANGMFVENPENPSTHEPYEMITPLEIDLVFDADQSHVYNGQTFAASYNAGDAITSAVSGLFTLRTTTGGNSISYLIAGNVLIGSYNIGGAVNAGNNYTLTGSFHTEDAESAENYIVSVVDATYTIEQRYMKVDYTNLLQSINTAKSDVGGTFNLAESDDTDLVWFGNTISLATLTSSLTITITNTGWKSDIASKTSYTRYVGAATAGSNLRVVLSSNNYYIDYPVLQVTYMTNGGSYSGFTVDDLNDLMHLDSDSYGLYLARTDPNDPVGVLPTFTQTADISGLLTSGAYTALPTIRPFHANYVGNNHSISNIIVVNNSDMEQSDSKYFGFFSKIEEGVVENIHLYDVYLYSTTPKTAIGGLAGEISGLTTEVNGIILNVTIIANADDNDREEDVYIGGMVGLLTDGSIDEATVLGYVRINGVSADNIYYGGVIGYAEAGAASDLLSFVDSSVFANGITYYCGGIIGDNGVSFELSDYSYLKSALYVKESNNSHILRDSAFGNAVNPNASVSKDYNDMYTALNAASVPGTLLDAYDIVETYMIRTYLFATGCTGTTSNKVVITNYRQIALLLAYPYLNFSVNADIFSPIDLNQYDRGFSGSITYVGGTTIKAYNVHSTINLFAVARDTNVVVSLSPRREL